MTVPHLLVLTDRTQARRPLPEVMRDAVAGGCRAVLLREKDLPRRARVELARALAPDVHAVGGILLAAGGALPGCDGVHLPRPGPPGRAEGPRLGGLAGRSCHDAAEVAAAESDGADYVTVSPVFASASKPGYGPPLGPDGLRAVVRGANVPVLALGGIETPDDVRRCRDAGAHGVAVMGAVMRAADPRRRTRALVAAAEEVR